MTADFEVLLEELRPLARIHWTDPTQLHITTKFIGAFPFVRVSELCRYLSSRPPLPKFTVTLKGLKYFRTPQQSWVLYVRVEPTEPILQLAAAMDDWLGLYKIRRDADIYLPHVTIGKIPGNNPWPKLDERVEAYLEKPMGEFEVTEYHLYESTPSGYRKCISIPLV